MCEKCKYFDDIANDTACVTCMPPDYDGFEEKEPSYKESVSRAIERFYESKQRKCGHPF